MILSLQTLLELSLGKCLLDFQPCKSRLIVSCVGRFSYFQSQVLYLVRCYRRHRQEEHACGKRASVAPLSTLLASVRHQLVTFLALQLRSQSDPPATHSPLYTLIAEEQMPFDMVVCLVTQLTEDKTCPSALNMIFSPLLQHCLSEARRHKALTSAHYLTPAMVLTSLTKLKLASNNLRPLADLLVEQPQWLPSGLSPASGLEVVGLSYLGPFLRFSSYLTASKFLVLMMPTLQSLCVPR